MHFAIDFSKLIKLILIKVEQELLQLYIQIHKAVDLLWIYIFIVAFDISYYGIIIL